jgi:hypothetical protein
MGMLMMGFKMFRLWLLLGIMFRKVTEMDRVRG